MDVNDEIDLFEHYETLTSLNAANIYGAKKVLFVTKKKAISSILNDYKLINPELS